VLRLAPVRFGEPLEAVRAREKALLEERAALWATLEGEIEQLLEARYRVGQNELITDQHVDVLVRKGGRGGLHPLARPDHASTGACSVGAGVWRGPSVPANSPLAKVQRLKPPTTAAEPLIAPQPSGEHSGPFIGTSPHSFHSSGTRGSGK
jgi:hypothetical protein